MDLNYLYRRKQASLAMSEQAACDRSRRAHLQLAHGYGSMIARAKRGNAVGE